MDSNIWVLLGISTTSLIGTPLLYSSKQQVEPGRTADETQAMVQKAANAFNEKPADVDSNRAGTLYGNPTLADARFTDLFEGDEVANAPLLDVSKVQLFFFTIIFAVAYGAQLYHMIAHDVLTDDVSLPTLNAGLLALMGVSHAGYLGRKGISSTPTH